MNDAAIEEDLRCIRNTIELLQGLVKFVIVVVVEGSDPGLDFLFGQ
jgi:hypothetical protein